MKLKSYINGMGCVSAQKTFQEGFVDNAEVNTSRNLLSVEVPNYKDYISPAAIRRMAKGVKNGIVASAMAMKEANIDNVDAIITGSGMGCIEDSENFLKAIIDNNEEFLTPTSFIQSTHNTVAAQIALGMKCTGYNFTYVNGAISFESALLDAKSMIEAGDATSAMVGGVDEIAPHTMKLYELAGFIKSKEEVDVPLLKSAGTGAIFGEGATFFILEDQITASTYAKLTDIEIFNHLSPSEVQKAAISFLEKNEISISEVDAVILGYNGEADFDHYYNELAANVFPDILQLYYKHLSGEYNTASAFGLWIGANIIKTGTVPKIIKINQKERKNYKNILLYNQYRGRDHSFVLISSP